MKKLALVLSLISLVGISSLGHAVDADQPAPGPPNVPILASPSDLKWGPAPPVVPVGSQAAVLDGDPFKEGSPYTLRL